MLSLIVTARYYAVAAVDSLRARMGEERGQDLIEYALLGGLIAAAITLAAVVAALQGGLTSMATGIAECIDFGDDLC